MERSGKNIFKELKSKPSGFVVPDNYFKNFKVRKSSNKSGFKVPENYFEHFEVDILSGLKKDKQNTGFKLPEDYLENFEVKIPVTLKQNGQISKRTKIVRLISWTAAASVMLLMGLSLFQKDKTLSFDTLSYNDLESYLTETSMLMESNTIAENYSDIDLTLAAFDLEDEITEYLSEKKIEPLLIQE